MTSTTIRTLLVGESRLRRAELVRALESDGDICVIGQAVTSLEAIQLVEQVKPDVVVIDLKLAEDGSQHAIEQIMARNPTPILALVTGPDGRRSPSAVEALVAGALDALPNHAQWTPEAQAELRHSVRQLRKVPVIRHPRGNLSRTGHRAVSHGQAQPVVAVAASTGGPSALAALLSGLGGVLAPVLVVQHLHADFTNGFLKWMSRASALPVEIAEQGHVLQPGHVYLAPGDLHLRMGPDLRIELTATPASIHRPSADQLFGSVATHAKGSGIGVLMTGMGEDGAKGLLEIHLAGGRTLAQDEASCAVFGMPRAAELLGAVTNMLPPDQLAAAVRRIVAELRA